MFRTSRLGLRRESRLFTEHSVWRTCRICRLPRSIALLSLCHCCFRRAHLNALPHSTRFLNRPPFLHSRPLLSLHFQVYISILRWWMKLAEKDTQGLAGLCWGELVCSVLLSVGYFSKTLSSTFWKSKAIFHSLTRSLCIYRLPQNSISVCGLSQGSCH